MNGSKHHGRGIALWLALLLALVGMLACSLTSGGLGPEEIAAQVAGTRAELESQAAHATETAAAGLPTDSAPGPVQPNNTEPALDSVDPPMFQPGELVVAYVDGGHPWLWTQETGSSRLSATGDVEDILISDDGERVVFVRRMPADPQQPAEVLAVDADGGNEQVLLAASDFDALHRLEDFVHNDLSQMAFIPTSHDLLFNVRGVPEGPGLIKYNDLFILDADSGELQALRPAGEGGDFVASPDGQTLAIVRPGSISLATVEGATIREDAVSFDPIITYSEFQYYVEPVWTPNSAELLVAVPSSDPLATLANGTVWRIPADGSDASRLGTFEGSFYFPQQGGGSLISPTLDQVAYLHGVDGAQGLYLANIDGSGVTLYDSGSIQWRGWSSDGLAFGYFRDDSGVMQLGRPGSPYQTLVTGTEVVWTGPDSFLFTQGSFGEWALYRGWTAIGDPALISRPDADFIDFDWARP